MYVNLLKHTERPLKNLTFSATLRKRMGFYVVTGVGALFFRNVSMGEIPPGAGRGAKLPRRYVAEKTSPRALELKKSPSSLKKWVMQRSPAVSVAGLPAVSVVG
jgi:hypothetical protein